MGKAADWIRNEVDKRLRWAVANNLGALNLQAQQPSDVEFITFTNGLKTKGVTKNGNFTVNTVTKGNVEGSGWGIRINKKTNTYLVQGDKIRPKSTDGGGVDVYLTVEKQSDGTFYVGKFATDFPTLYSLNAYTIANLDATEQGEWQNVFIKFSPNGSHILVLFEFPGTSDGFRLKWGWAVSYTLTTVNNVNVVQYASLIQKQVILDSTTLPNASSPTAPGIPAPIIDPITPATTTFEADSDPYLNGLGNGTSGLLGYSLILYTDNNIPKLDIIGNWRSTTTTGSAWRIQSGTYGPYQQDVLGDGSWYRLINGNIIEYYGAGPASFVPGPGITINYITVAVNPVQANLTSFFFSGGFDNYKVGFVPTYPYCPGRNTVFGSIVPAFLQGFFWPSTPFGAAHLANEVADLPPDLYSLTMRSGLWVNEPGLGFGVFTYYWINTNNLMCLVSCKDGGVITTSSPKLQGIVWTSFSDSTNKVMVMVPQYTINGVPQWVFGTNTDYTFGINYDPQLFPGFQNSYGFALDSAGGASFGFNKVTYDSNNNPTTYSATVKSNLDNTAIITAPYDLQHQHIPGSWVINTDYLSLIETQPLFNTSTDTAPFTYEVSNEICLLDILDNPPVAPVTAPFQAIYPFTISESVKTVASQTFQSIDAINSVGTVQAWTWNDTTNVVRTGSSKTQTPNFGSPSYLIYDWYLKQR